MGLFKAALLSALLYLFPLTSIEKEQISYLLKAKEFVKAFTLYDAYQKEYGAHDFDVLLELGITLLKMGAESQELNSQLSALYGLQASQITHSVEIIEETLHSPHLETQVAALSLLAKLSHDRGDELLARSVTSSYPVIALESAYLLAHKKHPKSSAYLEALMHKFPPEFSAYFPPLFAMTSSKDALKNLKQLMHSPLIHTRIEAILAVANYQLEDFIPFIRNYLTHTDLKELEASTLALALLKDSHSLPKIQKLALSSSSSLKLTALYALYLLGDFNALTPIEKLAQEGDLFAITLLGELPSHPLVLQELLSHPSIHVRFNATLSLLLQKDPTCLKTLPEFLFHQSQDLGFFPLASPGKALRSWKVIPSVSQQETNYALFVKESSYSLRQEMLMHTLELEERDFLLIASQIFENQQVELIPLLCHLLENHKTEGCINLLKKYAALGELPFIRMCCHLALFRLKEEGPYDTRLKEWIHETCHIDMVGFRPSLPKMKGISPSSYELTPHENAALLMQSYEAIAKRHTHEGIDLLLEGIRHGHPHNRYVLAGLLLHAIQ
ncbi:hypothetical protein [Rhabdochlamydiaceae symbiont of Dictyostelium giganteum]|uniref:hypothetical protein n=1 Tax=Rhabdochlamydiaceae symbiont of Dictyostelium giganteum TaxID=3342349 RepID=UPI00384AF45C